MFHQLHEFKSEVEYVVGINRWKFKNIAIWYSCHNTYHYMVLGCLHTNSLIKMEVPRIVMEIYFEGYHQEGYEGGR